MKKLISLCGAFLSLLLLTPVWADNISNNISANLDQTTLDALAKDIGSLMGGASFHQGKALGFPLGVDIGAHGVAIDVQDDDKILRDDSSRAQAGWVQAELGLPARINLIGRYGQFEDADMYGGGVRFGILSPSVPLAPALSITALYDKFNHDDVDADTISANAVLSVDVPFIHPYLGVGWDHTKLEVQDPAADAAVPPAPHGKNASVSGYRAEIGVNISIIPFTYLNLGAGMANSKAMYHAGLGVKF